MKLIWHAREMPANASPGLPGVVTGLINSLSDVDKKRRHHLRRHHLRRHHLFTHAVSPV